MSSEEITDEEDEAVTEDESTDSGDVRERLEQGADRAVEGFDEGVVDLLSWVLDTETRAKIYIHLRTNPDSTSDEIAEGTGLYPSTVREALADLHEEGTVERGKRESDGAGNNPYEYRAIPPSALVRGAVEDVQESLNAVFQLDRYMGGEETGDEEPVTITVEEESTADAEWGEASEDGESETEGDAGAKDGETKDGEANDADDEDAEESDEATEEDEGEEQDEDIDESL